MTDPQLDADVEYVSRDVESRYEHYVDRADISQELYGWALGDGASVLTAWREDPDREDARFRTLRALFLVGKNYAEQEKCSKTGSHFSDTAWYSPAQVELLLPLADNPGWDGQVADSELDDHAGIAKEGGNLLAMVMDVRRARAAGCHTADQIADWLGGEYPGAPGYDRAWRKAMSNDLAQQITARAEQLWG